MKNKERNSFIINHSLHVYLTAAIMSSIVGQLNVTIDGIIVSNAVSADAISVIALAFPLLNIASIVGIIIFSGAGLLIAPALGNQQYQQANRIFTICLTSVLVLNGLIACVLYSCSSSISQLLTHDARLLPLLNDYLPIAFIGCVATLLAMSLGQFIEISGHPRLVTRAMLVLSMTNIVLDLLLVVQFQLGMRGAALASALSPVIASLTYVPYLAREPRPFHFDLPFSCESLKLGMECVLRGLPNAIGIFSMVAMFMGLNVIVMHAQGADGMFILSVCMQIFSIGMLVIGGAGQAITGIGGRLYGEQDWKGMIQLFDSIYKIVIGGAAFITLMLFLFPTPLARLFGAGEALVAISEQPLRLFCLTLIPLAVTMLQVSIFLITNRGMVASCLQIGLVACILLPFWAFSLWSPSHIWIAFPSGMWLMMAVTLTISLVLSKRKAPTHRIYLVPTIGQIDSYSVSVKYSFNEVVDKLSDILFYINIFDLGDERMKDIRHCLEEVMFRQYDMGQKEGKKGFYDVSVVDQAERFTIIVKDVGKPYNPLVTYRPGLLEDIKEDELGMVMVQNICSEVNYKYQNGLNCLYINITK